MEDQSTPNFTIRAPNYPEDLPEIRELFAAYALSLNIDLSFQDFSTELDSLPGKYSPAKGGGLLLAFSNLPDRKKEAIGCIAVRSLANLESTTKVCEMKRLYCTPASRGFGVGRALAEKVIEVARDLGYEEMRLDTLESMHGARKLYQSFGFVEIEAYYETPLKDTIFLSKKLRQS